MGNCTTNGDIDESAKVQNTEQKDVETQEIEHSINTEDDALKPDGDIEPIKDEKPQTEKAPVAEPKVDVASKDDTQDIDRQMKGLNIEEVDETKTTEATLEQDSIPEPDVAMEEEDGEDHKMPEMQQEEPTKEVVGNTDDALPDSVVPDDKQAADPILEPSKQDVDAIETTQNSKEEEEPAEDGPTGDEPTVDVPAEDRPEEAEAMVMAVEEEAPAEEEEIVDEQTVEEPTVQEPILEEATIDEPTVVITEEEPVEDEAAIDEAVMGGPIVEEPTDDEPTVDEQAAAEPAEDEHDPTTDEQAEDDLTEDDPTVNEPAVDDPTVEEPAVEEPKEDVPIENEATTVADADHVAIGDGPLLDECDEEFSGPPKTEQQIREEVERELKLEDNDPTENAGSEDEMEAQGDEPKKVDETKWEVVAEPNDSPVIVEPDQSTEQQHNEQANE